MDQKFRIERDPVDGRLNVHLYLSKEEVADPTSFPEEFQSCLDAWKEETMFQTDATITTAVEEILRDLCTAP